MSLLLDTHVVLWWLQDNPTLDGSVKDRIDNEPGIYVSVATIWEVAIKEALGKFGTGSNLARTIRNSDFQEIPVSSLHALTAG